MTLTSERVEEIGLDCVWPSDEADRLSEDEMKERSIIAEGVIHTYGFRPEKIAEHREELREMIRELPTEFLATREGGGGGWSFLNLCVTKDGEQWTGLHLMQERFMCLCIAAGLAEIPLPREMWSSLPGGVPYVVFNTELVASL